MRNSKSPPCGYLCLLFNLKLTLSAWHQEIRCILFTACSRPRSGLLPCRHASHTKLPNKAAVVVSHARFSDPSVRAYRTCGIVQLPAYWQRYRSGRSEDWSSGCDFPSEAAPGVLKQMVAHYCVQTPDLHTHFCRPPPHPPTPITLLLLFRVMPPIPRLSA